MNKLPISPNNNLGNTSNLNTSILDYALTLEKGLYCVNLNGGAYTANDLPSSEYAYLSAVISVRHKKTSVFVMLLGGSEKTPISINSLNNKVWTGWVQYTTKADLSALWPVNAGTEIVAGTDMKTITAPGYYYCVNNNTAGSLKNCPLTEAFTLVVYRAAGGMGNNTFYIAQEYTSYICNKRIIQTYNKDSGNWTTHEIQFKS